MSSNIVHWVYKPTPLPPEAARKRQELWEKMGQLIEAKWPEMHPSHLWDNVNFTPRILQLEIESDEIDKRAAEAGVTPSGVAYHSHWLWEKLLKDDDFQKLWNGEMKSLSEKAGMALWEVDVKYYRKMPFTKD